MERFSSYLVAFIIGVLLGCGVCKKCTCHIRNIDEGQRDTIVRIDTIRYSRLDLSSKIEKLTIPSNASIGKVVLLPTDSVTYIYRDSVRYVTLPRDFFYTKTNEAEIWHSGIDSTIDSLNVFNRTTEVVKFTPDDRHWDKHRLSLYGSAGYSNMPLMSAGIRYMYYPKKWFGVGVKGEKDFISDLNSVLVTTEIGFSW